MHVCSVTIRYTDLPFLICPNKDGNGTHGLTATCFILTRAPQCTLLLQNISKVQPPSKVIYQLKSDMSVQNKQTKKSIQTQQVFRLVYSDETELFNKMPPGPQG